MTGTIGALTLLAGLGLTFSLQPSASAFEGRIQATVTQGGQNSGLLYVVGTNQLRIEKSDTNWPHARNVVDLQTGAVTLLFPHNRSFVRLKSVATGVPPASEGGILTPGSRPNAFRPGSVPNLPTPGTPAAAPAIGPTNLPGAPAPPPMPPMPTTPGPSEARMPPGIGPQPGSTPGLATRPGMGLGMPSMPPMPPMPMMAMGMQEKAELNATGQKTNLLGYVCERFELKLRRQTLDIWATDQLFPFQTYHQNQPRPAGPRVLEEQWPGRLKARRLFPLLVTLRLESGPERYRFEVNSIRPEKITDLGGQLFQPPPDYREIEPLPF